MSLYGIILAAGEGKRMKSKTAKPLQIAGGRALIDHVLSAAEAAGAERCIVVTGHMADEIRSHLGESVEYAYQPEPLGTGHAVLQTAELLKNTEGTALVVCSDTPLITATSLKKAYDEHIEAGRAATVISSDMYFFDIKKLTDIESGYSLADIFEALSENGEKTGVFELDFEEALDVNDMVQLAEADMLLNKREIKRLMQSGVRILNPDSVRVDCGVRVGRDTVIYPNTILEGTTEIGEDCVIGPNTRIRNCKIGGKTEVQSSVALDSEIGSNTSIGPFAYIRPNSKIGDNIKVGDFVEVKNATIGNNTKIAHLTYVGDADVGERVNFGCGTVVVNYDGAHKHRTTIGDDCFIGCNTNLVSPVKVNDGAYTAAGSTITDEVPENALAIARARQVNKTGWKRPKK